MRNRISKATKRIAFEQLARSVAIGCTLVISSQHWVVGQEATCGCEVQVATCDGSCSKTKKPKQISLAQQFLKQFDRIGDEIEAQVRFKQPGNRKIAKANCGVEHQGASCGTEFVEPTCGAESNGPSCGCEICSTPTYTPNYPLPPAVEMHRSQPLYYQESPSIQSNPPGPPVKKRMPTTPMHPKISPDQQAMGKILDQPAAAPSIPVRKIEPAPRTRDLPTEIREVPNPTPTVTREPFAPRQPQVSPKPIDEAVPRLPFSNPQPARLPTLPSDPGGSPARNLPQSQDEIPDVLVDPFKDDASWRGRRDQMNGVRQTGGSVIDLAEPTPTVSRPVQLKRVPIQATEETPTSVISIGPSFSSEDNADAVVASSHLERLPVKVHTVKRSFSSTDNETTPSVKRTPVPKK